ncbi:MAG: FAD binding domain-containing protein [Nitrososphaerota archaeon]|nr:FAD binding domain-containing protein [Nitrososphaerota archaeon]MDG7026494.1 FAD binding domain-containing protein [Nitrososphaerota archaeon]
MPRVYVKPYSEFRPDEYIRAKSKEEVVSLLKQYGEAARVVGAGITIHEMGVLGFLPQVKKLIDVRAVGLDYVAVTGKWIKVGGSTTVGNMGDHEIFRNQPIYQTVSEAADSFPLQVANAATIAGNICSAVPIVSMPPVLMTLDAQVVLLGSSGERILPVDSLYEDYLITKMKPDEFLTEVQIPLRDGKGASVYVAEKTVAADYPTVSLSASVFLDDGGKVKDCRIAMGSVGRTARRLPEAEKTLRGAKMEAQSYARAGEAAAKEIDPSADLRASHEYRRILTRYLTKKALGRVAEKLGVK